MTMLAMTAPTGALAKTFQFDYAGYLGGAYEPFHPMKSSLTYYIRDSGNFVTHIAFNDGWYSDDDAGLTFIARDTSLNFGEFLGFLTNGNDEEIWLCFGG